MTGRRPGPREVAMRTMRGRGWGLVTAALLGAAAGTPGAAAATPGAPAVVLPPVAEPDTGPQREPPPGPYAPAGAAAPQGSAPAPGLSEAPPALPVLPA